MQKVMQNTTVMMSRELPMVASAIHQTLLANAGCEIPFVLFVFAPERMEVISNSVRDVYLQMLGKWVEFVRNPVRPEVQLSESDIKAITCMEPICQFVRESISIVAGPMTFALIMSVSGNCVYGSNTDRDDVFTVLSEFLNDMNRGADLKPPAHKLELH